MLAIIGWMIFGMIVGMIARACYPGPQPMGLIKTMVLGIAGSFIGGFLGYLIHGGALVQASGWIGSIVGAIALIALTQSRRSHLVS